MSGSRRAGFEAADIDFVFLYELPERPAVFFGHLRGLGNIALTGRQQSLNIVPLKACNLLSFGLPQGFCAAERLCSTYHKISALDDWSLTQHQRALDHVL